ncbi:MAG: hypothetical protein AAFV19_20555 [Pseudomonadota bacterium]
MGRFHSESNKALAILAGSLGDALRMHAAQRAQYFFNFLFFHQALVDRMRGAHGLSVADGEGVSVKATHQIAYGLRRGDDAYYLFLDKDPSIVDQPATSCGKTDAAHYCNLGITGSFLGKAAAVARPDVDPVAFKLRDMLEVMAGATRQLPQRVNIGPDRVVDRVHGELARRFLTGDPPLTPGNYGAYLDLAAQEMTKYRKAHLAKRNLGIAACCDSYLDFYAGSPKCKTPHDVDGVLRMLRSTTEAECAALGLDAGRYLSRSVR